MGNWSKSIGVTPEEMKQMYMEYGVTFDSLAKRLDTTRKTVRSYVCPLLSEEDKNQKEIERKEKVAEATRIRWASRYTANEQANVVKNETVMEEEKPVPSLMDRLKQRDENAGIYRKSTFDGLKITEETHTYWLKGNFGTYLVDVTKHVVKIILDDDDESLNFYVDKESIGSLIRELQSINAAL